MTLYPMNIRCPQLKKYAFYHALTENLMNTQYLQSKKYSFYHALNPMNTQYSFENVLTVNLMNNFQTNRSNLVSSALSLQIIQQQWMKYRTLHKYQLVPSSIAAKQEVLMAVLCCDSFFLILTHPIFESILIIH